MRSDAVMRDDLVHMPAGHLQSYRPLFFADLWFWNHLVGKEYLLTIVPKILGGLWAVLLALLTASVLRRRSSWPVLYGGIPLLFLSHPIVNELTLFNVVVPVMLSMLLAVAAFALLDGRITAGRCIAATLLLTISIAGYQINLTVFVLLMAFAATAELVQLGAFDGRNLVRRAAVAACAVLLYLTYFYARPPAVTPAWGRRGLPSLRGVRVADVMHAKWHGITNMLADVTQPALSWLVSERAGWRMWSVPYLLLIALLMAGVARGRTRGETVRAGLGAICLLLIPAAVLLAMNVTPEGWRVCGPAVYALALVVALTLLAWEPGGPAQRPTAAALLTLLIALSMRLTRFDAGLRAEAAVRDEAAVQLIRARYATGPSPAVVIVPVVKKGEIVAPERRGFVMAEFRPVSWVDYSNLWPAWSFPDAYLRKHGIVVLSPDDRAAEVCRIASPRRMIIFDDAARRAYVCR